MVAYCGGSPNPIYTYLPTNRAYQNTIKLSRTHIIIVRFILWQNWMKLFTRARDCTIPIRKKFMIFLYTILLQVKITLCFFFHKKNHVCLCCKKKNTLTHCMRVRSPCFILYRTHASRGSVAYAVQGQPYKNFNL